MSRFRIAFHNSAAQKEYRKLSPSERRLVDIALRKLMDRADEIGTPLERELAGCKKIKWRNAGLRMVFRIAGDAVEVVEIVAIGSRDKERVYKSAARRLDAPPQRTNLPDAEIG